MGMVIELSPTAEQSLSAMAEKNGTTLEVFAKDALEQIAVTGKYPRTLAEVMAPFAAEFEASGMTEEELDALVEEAREEIYREKHGRGSKQR
jgi:hypothetical protein